MKGAFSSAFVILCLLASAFASQQKTGTLKGRIENEKGKPLAEAEIRVMRTSDRTVKEARTDQSGNYSFELLPGDYTVSFDAEGYQGGNLAAMQQVEEGQETVVKTVRLQKGQRTSRIRGAVFDENGFSLGGVKLKLQRVATEDEEKQGKRIKSFSSEYVTNSRGEFAFRVPSESARYRVVAERSGYKSQTKVVDVTEGEAVPLAFSLEPKK
jgi:Carboxypeptidase regulatory-like domain